MSGRRRTLVWTLIVLASVIAIVSALTTWVHRQMLDEQSWRNASARLIEDPAVRDAVSVYVVNELYDNVDVSQSLQERLPTDLQALAAPAATALRPALTDAVNRLLQGPRVQKLFVNASSEAQQKLVNVLEDKTGHGITTGNGVVTLDLGGLVRQLATDLGLSQSTIDRIPADAGVITVGWALIAVGLVLLVARRLAGNYAIDALTTPASEDAGRQAWLIGSSILAEIGWAALIYGAVVVLGSVFAGPTGIATSARRRVAPVLNERPGVAWAIAGGVFLLLVIWGPTHALRVAWGIALLGVLLAAGIVALRRQTLREVRGVIA
jgi:hypothetical protein